MNPPPKKILIGVSGGIAAYKSPELARALQKQGFEVRFVLTENAKQFVSPLVLETLTGFAAQSTLWGNDVSGTEHIELARWPDLVLVAPATANLVAKLSLGLADDLLSTLILATYSPVIIAPAMNPGMWQNAVTQENIQRLVDRGMTLIPPENGELACGETGAGRLPDFSTLIEACETALGGQAGRSLEGTSWLITAGPTKTYIDPVRYITNPSTGLMGKALAEEALARGARVHYVLGIDKGVVQPQPKSPDQATRLILTPVHTAQQMLEAALPVLQEVHGVIATAAVMDYEVSAPSPTKIKRQNSITQLELLPAVDVLRSLKLACQNPNTLFVGFAAETDQVLENGLRKRQSKDLHYVFANPVSKVESKTGFGASTNSGYWITPTSHETWELQSKREIASKIWDQLVEKK